MNQRTKRRSVLAISFILVSATFSRAEDAAAPEIPKEGDGGWPKIVTSEAGSKILMHQPQIESWQDQKVIDAWSAVEFQAERQKSSDLGVIEILADTSVAMEERLVKLQNIRIKQVNFPTLEQGRAREIASTVTKKFPKDGLVIALDRILAAVDKSQIKAAGVSVNQSPPPIFYSKRPALLVQFDGEPIMSPIKDSTLKFIVNTNWDVLQDPDEGKYYLRYEKSWWAFPELDKEWKQVSKLPKSFETLPKDANWDDVRAAMPPKTLSKSKSPLFYVSKQPAELIVTDGKPELERVEKSKLYWVSNTECDVFQMKRGAYYFLVAGRWFKADKLEGPWTFATSDLPKEFLDIPRTHPRARVRASIPGTDEAAEAVLLAQIPRTLRVETKNVQSPEVKYQGEPKFVDIKGTKVSYATNCSNDVLKVGEIYYLCYQGAWLNSRKAVGPWELSKSVPDEIYKIPPECPLHHVTYVKVGSSDAESVTYVQTSGYSGVTVSFGVAMYGTGWYYPPYYYGGGYYPVYYPYHSSYGGYAIYNSRTGAYGYGSTVAGPNGGLSHAATYNPNTGTYRRGTAAWGPNGGKAQGSAYNPRTGTSLETRQGRNENGNWGTTKVQRGDDWAQRGHVNTDKGSLSGVRTSEGNGAIRASGENGSGFVGKKGDDIYAGKDGNVYRKTEDGWQERTEGGWSDVNRGEPKPGTRDQTDRGSRTDRGTTSAGTRDQLNRDSGSRAQGDRRVQQSGNYNRGGGSSGRGSYGGGGGGMRGGGGGGRRR